MTTPHTPARVQLRRTKGWRMPPQCVKVARPSRWGNPFTVAAHGVDAVEMFRKWLAGEPLSAGERFTFLTDRRAELLARLPELKGKSLACFCPLSDACHADVLLELANKESDQ